jgi:hypothetical protein
LPAARLGGSRPFAKAVGTYNVNVLPAPSVLCTVTDPPCARAISSTMLRAETHAEFALASR